MKQTDTIALQGSIADIRQHIAVKQAAMHRVKLGVARWRNAPAADTDAPPLPASQTRWHAEAQWHFMHWLELGGFAHAVAGMHADAHADKDAYADSDNDMHAAADKLSTSAMAHTPPDTGTSNSSCTSNNSGTATATTRQATEAPVPEHCNNCAA